MAFQLSPGVNVSEIDLTTSIPALSTSIGAFAGEFSWGPANEIVTVSSENNLVSTFGEPDANTYEYFYTAANFLSYSNNLKVVRAVDSDVSKNATANSASGVLIENLSDYEQTSSFSGGSTFAAKYFGAKGNSLKIVLMDAGNYSGSAAGYKAQFQSAPATSDYASAAGSANDEIHILVIDEDGEFTGVANTVLEKFGYVSKASDAKNSDGSTNYYVNVLKQRSKYVWWTNHPEGMTDWGTTATSNADFDNLSASYELSFDGGVDGTTLEIANAYTLFANPDSTDISLMLAGPADSALIISLTNIVETRKDCLLFVSPEKDDVVEQPGAEKTNIVAFRDTLTSSSYVVMDSGWKYQYDKYNDLYRWIPLNGDIAGLCARTDRERDPWFSPAGANRGIIKNVVKLAWNPTQAERDDLYQKGVNSVVSFPGEGTILYGDKTMLARPSAFDRINVRRLFIVLEKSIARAARSSLFEFNDQFTRAQFTALVEPFLRDVQGRRGIFDFRVVCDETNNTAEVIDRNEFIGDIYIKPARSINFIQLNFVAVRTGVSFDEIVGQF